MRLVIYLFTKFLMRLSKILEHPASSDWLNQSSHRSVNQIGKERPAHLRLQKQVPVIDFKMPTKVRGARSKLEWLVLLT